MVVMLCCIMLITTPLRTHGTFTGYGLSADPVSDTRYSADCGQESSGRDWDNVGRIEGAPDGSYSRVPSACCSGNTERIDCDRYGFNVPTDAVLTGFEIAAHIRRSTGGQWGTYDFQLQRDDDRVGTDYDNVFPAAGASILSFGGPYDMMGEPNFPISEVNDYEGFGAFIRFYRGNTDICDCFDLGSNAWIELDSLVVTVYYKTPVTVTASSASEWVTYNGFVVITGTNLNLMPDPKCTFSIGGSYDVNILDTANGNWLICQVPPAAAKGTTIGVTLDSDGTKPFSGTFSVSIIDDDDAEVLVSGLSVTSLPADVDNKNDPSPSFNIVTTNGITGPNPIWMALVAQGSTCASGTRIGAFEVTNVGNQAFAELPSTAGDFELCVSANGNSGPDYHKVPSYTLTTYEALATDIVAVTPTAIGVGTKVTLSVQIDSDRTIIAGPSTLIGAGQGGCTTGAIIATAPFPLPGSTLDIPASAVVNPVDLTICLSVFADSWVPQTSAPLVRFFDATISGVEPNTWGAFGLPTLTFVGAEYTSTGTQFAFSDSGASGCTSGTPDSPVPFVGGPTPLSSPLDDGIYTVCGSVNGGDSYASTGVTVEVISASGELSGVAPPTFLSDTLTLLSFTGLTPSVTTSVDIVTSSSGCINVAATIPIFPSATDIPISLPAGTYYTCVSTGGAGVNQGTAGRFVVANKNANDVTKLDSPLIAYRDQAVTLTFSAATLNSLLPSFPSSAVSLAFPGGCSSPALRTATSPVSALSSGAFSTTLTIPAAWPVSPPSVELDVCYSYDGVSFSTQLSSLEVLISSPLSITGFSPSSFVNQSQPGFQIDGLEAVSFLYISLALPGTCTDVPNHLISGVVLDAEDLALFASPLSLDADVASIALCVSIDGGVSYVDQAIGSSIPVVNNPLALLVTEVVPTGVVSPPAVLVANAPTVLQVTGDHTQYGSPSQIAFSRSSCLAEQLAPVSTSASATFSTTSVTLPAPGRHFTCYSEDSGGSYPPSSWVQQIAIQSQVFVLPASSGDVIASVVPNVVGEGSTRTLRLTRSSSVVAIGCPTCVLGIDPSTCTGTPAFTVPVPSALTSQDVVVSNLIGNGNHVVCFSTDSGAANSFVQQSSVGISVVAAVGSAVDTVIPAAFATTMTPLLSVSTVFASPTTRLALTTASDCLSPGSFATPAFVYDVDNKPWRISPPLAVAGTYTLCYSVNSGSSYVAAAATVSLLSISPTSISSFSPTTIGARTTPDISYVGAEASPYSGLAYVLNSAIGVPDVCNDPARRVGTALLTSLGPLALGSAIDVLGTTEFALCYSVTAGVTPDAGTEDWILQTAVPDTLTVVTASPNTIDSLSPPILAVNTMEQVTLSGLVATPTTRIGFTRTGTCTGTGVVSGITPYTSDTGGVFTLATGLDTVGEYRVCYSVDAGATWLLQADENVVTTVVAALPTAVTDYTPTSTGANTFPVFTFTGSIPLTPNVKLGFGETNCVSTIVGVIDATSWVDETTPLSWAVAPTPASSTSYVLCLSVDGTNYVEQSSAPTFRIETATSSSITLMTSSSWGVGATGFEVVLTGSALPTPTSYIGLTSGSCADPPNTYALILHFWTGSGGNAVDDSTLSIDSPLVSDGVYDVCYSVESDSTGFVDQSSVSITVVPATAGDLLDINPKTWGSYVLQTLTPTFSGGFAVTPTTRIGFAEWTTVGSCSAATGSTIQGMSVLDGSPSVALASGLTFVSNYTVCISVDGGMTWVDATDPVTAVTVTGATSETITGLTRTVADANIEFEVAFEGANLGGLTQVGLANLGFSASSSAIPGTSAASPASPAQTACNEPGSVLGLSTLDSGNAINVTLSDNGNYAVCYSENGGLNFEAQTLPGTTLVVQDCSLYTSCGACRTTPTCAWCLADEQCVSDNTQCSTQAVCPAPTCSGQQTSCPSLEAIPTEPAIGVYTGGSTLALATTYAVSPAGGLECEFFNPATLTRTRTPATVVSTTRIECVAPPSELNLVDAEVQVFSGTELYTATGAKVEFEYYICEDVEVCGGCNTAARPECGYCMETQTCSAADQCAAPATWGGAECPVISSVSPGDGLVTGGAVLTLTGTYFVDVPNMEVQFGATGTRVNASFVSTTSYTVVSPVVANPGPVVLSLQRNGLTYVPESSGAVFNLLGDPALLPKPSPPTSPAVIGGAVGAVLIVLIIIAVILGLLYQRKKARDALLRPPVLTPEMREQIMFGTVPTLSAEDRKLLGHLSSFVDAVVMDHELIATMGDVTQSTEMDKITKAVNMVYESRGLSLRMLLYMVSREVALALSQSTLFRTNSFATKLFKTFSKMKGLDYLHATIGRPVNQMLLEGVGDVDSLKNKNANTTLERFALLERCQKVFAAIKESEPDVPQEFRFLFEHVRTRMQKKFPVSLDDLGLYIADSLRDHLDETSEAYIEGNTCFSDLASLAPHIQSDMAVLSSILGPVSDNLSNFEATIRSLSTQLHKVNSVVDQLRGALDPNSEQAARFLEEHQRVQNSIAVGGFMFLRFLVPALTAPEAFQMVHELPTPEERKLLVMIGKVLQNLSNGKEFGSKEKFMTSMNIYILENQDAVARLFESLSHVPEGTTAIESLERVSVPKRHLEAAVVTLFKHARTNREKIVARLHDHNFGGKRLPPAIISQREQAAKVFNLVLDQTQQFIDAGGSGVSSDYLVAGTNLEGGPPPRLQSMIQLTDEVFDSLMGLEDYVAPAATEDQLGDLGAEGGANEGVALSTLTLTPIAPRDFSTSSSSSSSSELDGGAGVAAVPDAPAPDAPAKPAPPIVPPVVEL